MQRSRIDRAASVLSSIAVALLALVSAMRLHECQSGLGVPPSLHDDSQYLVSA
jgi:hypothetical protein